MAQHVGKDHGYVGLVTFKPTNLRSHPFKLFQQKITSFHPLAHDPTLDRLPLPSNCFHAILHTLIR